MRVSWFHSFGWAFLLVLGGCSSGTPTQAACVRGTTIACLGPGACVGAQACLADGSGYGDCVCAADATSAGDTDTAADGDTAVADSRLDDAVVPDADTADVGASDSSADASAETALPDTMSQDGAATSDGSSDGAIAANPACDLNGRWLVSQRVLATSLGQKQAPHSWFYLEISQSGEDVTVTRGLHCGLEVVKITTFGANMQCQAAWPGILQNCTSTGRKGTYRLTGDQCALTLAKEYVVRGATVSKYLNPATALPSAQAMGTTPGWEDWDLDSQPGITMNITGGASGKTYVVQRDWSEYAGTTVKSAIKFKVPVTWNAEQKILGSTSSLLEQSSTPDVDAAQHYVWFHRLSPDQATGSDAEICATVRTLKDTLVPEANN